MGEPGAGREPGAGLFDSMDPPKRQRHLGQGWGSCLSAAAVVLVGIFQLGLGLGWALCSLW